MDTSRQSGYAFVSQAGGVAVGVQSMTSIPAPPIFSTIRCSQPRSNLPSAGSIGVHANSPMRTRLILASRINLMSSSQRSSGQNSG